MGTLVDTEINRDYNADASSSQPVADTVVYQLVRVEDDGSLVPATVDEVMEAENLLEDDKNEASQVEITIHTGRQMPDEDISLKKSDLESSEGVSHSKFNAVELSKLNSKVQEESLPLAQALNNSPKNEDVASPLNNHCDHLNVCNEKLAPKTDYAQSTSLIDNHAAPLGSGETCSEHVNEAVTNGSLDSETCSNLMPDFSILKGEIHLDSLTIRELQEAFRATFGRQTSVKDKLWLKRRIAMGLTNSCDIPSGSFTIKDNKIVSKHDTEEVPCRLQASNSEAVPLSNDQVTAPIYDNCQGSPSSLANQAEDQQVPSCKRNRETILEYDVKSEDINEEPCASKRVRKPTKRYIEELSDFEARECTGKIFTPARISGHFHSSPKSIARPTHDSGLQGKTSVTRQESVGGFTVQVPYVCRVRRQRPRKSFMTFMNFVDSESEKRDQENFDIDERDVQHDMADIGEDNSDDSAYAKLKGSIKRKHHRAWTLCEVLKLVDGVARYGAGKWSEIKRIAFASYTYRTSVDLKDKWRNLLRASFALKTTEKAPKISRKPSSLPIPIPILMRVRELAEMHSKAGIDFSPRKVAGEVPTVLKEKGTGFL
ncbi:hypothetical protein J5N97_009444 [Dioscorea zingiberensis]|uniref:Uncharacterized protein n=1 Tax=Dioscorea zingiberensis TaxID=325984 RepID=A0A9D5CY90_9LILI|nr:hypothetical protein J5N97_009444 [Dioscorea zingiberensis]